MPVTGQSGIRLTPLTQYNPGIVAATLASSDIPVTPGRGILLSAVVVLALGWQVAFAQSETPALDETADDSVSGSYDDSTGSIEGAHDPLDRLSYKGWQLSGDLRVGYSRSETDERDGEKATTSVWLGRARFGGDYKINDWLQFNSRLAVVCTDDECNPELSLDPSDTQVLTVDQGTITFDELYLHVFRRERFDFAVGRMQTKFVTRAGVYAKSLDQNNSNSFTINWTDGIHGAYHLPNESTIHFIAEYNDKEGASNVRRSPLDFTRSSARWGYFMAWESLKRRGPITQRGIDITYLPSALRTEGGISSPVDDYIGIVARVAAARPFGDKGRRWNVSGEIGYAPETPTLSALNIPGDDKADGLAWAVTASIMDLWPRHSIGLNYAHTDAGWLLSPQYQNGEELLEARYIWRKEKSFAVEVRARWREDLDQQIDQARKRDGVDFFVRATVGF